MPGLDIPFVSVLVLCMNELHCVLTLALKSLVMDVKLEETMVKEYQ